ncbi:MAG: dephospho-CoA kinase [Eggerthellaceae bacterium]|jgi:dephospho-CoA kinase|nr:dephospho-CoA kinase [Eggerthellaceae bacterium]MCH4220454.1 dephospho-CoA kinase [Eggerthellaceae bacterium]
MKTYILIGGIGSGKTTISRLFAERGATCLDLDEVGHEILCQPDVIAMLSDTFGHRILDEKGTIDRSKLAHCAFRSPADTIKLNAITQPRLMKEAERQFRAYEQQGKSLVIVEISAYDGPAGRFAPFVRDADGIIAVTAPQRLRIERAVRKGFSKADVRRRIARQATDVQRGLWATYIIENKGSLENLNNRVDKVFQALQASDASAGDDVTTEGANLDGSSL